VSKKVWPAPADVKKASKEGRAVFKEFRDFAVRGNVVDMAVGIIIGAAFGTVVKSLVSDIVMPPFGLLGNMKFEELNVKLGESATGADISLNFGVFSTT
jgi:large conductance mechanosensitive channel